MICSLDILKKSENKNCSVKILESADSDLQLFLDRFGITSKQALIEPGPWGSFIIKCENQEVAIGPVLAGKLQVETI